jgi:hypothetical protein
VENPVTGLVPANPVPDPRVVVTPLSPDRAEEILCKYGLYGDWKHIIIGLRKGFDVGIKETPPRTYIFRQPCFVTFRSQFYTLVHCQRTSSRPLFRSLHPGRPRVHNRSIPNLPTRTGSQTAIEQAPTCSRHVVSQKRSRHRICQCRGRFRRFSHIMGHFRQHSGAHTFPSPWLRRSNLRHISRISHHTCPPQPTTCPLHLLGWFSIRRQGPHVRPHLKCWRIWCHSRHACGHLWSSRFRSNPKMGRRFLSNPAPPPNLDREGVHGPNRILWGAMEHREASPVCLNPEIHWVQLGPGAQICGFTKRKIASHSTACEGVAAPGSILLSTRSCQSPWKASARLLYPPPHQTFSSLSLTFLTELYLTSSQVAHNIISPTRPLVDSLPSTSSPKRGSPNGSRYSRPRLVGRCKYLVWHWHCHRQILRSVEICPRLPGRPKESLRYWLGRSSGSGTWHAPRDPAPALTRQQHISAFRQFWDCHGREQRSVQKLGDKQDTQARIFAPSKSQCSAACHICSESRQHFGCPLPRPNRGVSPRLSLGVHPSHRPTPRSPHWQTDSLVATTVFTLTSAPHLPDLSRSANGLLQLRPSPLRPKCKADERIFSWIGVNPPPASTIDNPVIHYLADLANHASLRDTGSYGSGLRKFHIFCDVFSIPEAQRLPASFQVLHSFALWAATDPESIDPLLHASAQFEPVSVGVVKKYLSAVRAWHIAQGWPEPLSEADHNRINWSLRGLENIQGTRSRALRPPITLNMLRGLKVTLNLSEPFDACIWAMASCAFFGMMRFGEVSVASRNTFSGAKHLKRSDVFLGSDLDGKRYACLDLPSAKTAKPGEIQSVYLTAQGDLCPLEALTNLARVVPAGPSDPLFSWRDKQSEVRPMVKAKALLRINTILGAWGWGTAFGHSFRIGGASFYLAQGVNPEIVRLAGRWKSLAYEAYIRAFEQVASRHMGNLAT